MDDDHARRKVLIAGYPKSGNTWLGYMLSHLLGARYVDLHRPDQPPTGSLETLSLIGWEGQFSPSSVYGEVCKTHAATTTFGPHASYEKVIHLVRDPRDAATSYYWHMRNVVTQNRRSGVVRRVYVGRPLWRRTVLRVAWEWPRHTLLWSQRECLLVQYEELHADCGVVLRRICDFLGVAPKPEVFRRTLAAFSFEVLSGGRQRGSENRRAFYRKGVVGDHARYFDAVDKALFRWRVRPAMRRVGYCV